MSVSTKTCMSCNKILPDHIDVGSRCPHCGVYFGEKVVKESVRPYVESHSDSNIIILISLGLLLFAFILPLLLVFLLDVDSGIKFYFSMLSFEAGIAGGAGLLIYYITQLKSGDFDWSEFSNPAFLFSGIAWTIINLFMISTVVSSIGNANEFINNILNLGFASFIGGGVIALFIGLIAALPILIYHEMKN